MTWEICKLRYHHGGKLVRTPRVRYVNGSVAEYDEDPNQIYYWTILSTIKDLGYDLAKTVKDYYIEDGKSLNTSLKLLGDYSNDAKLVDQLTKKMTLDIYVEQLNCANDMNIPIALLDSIEVSEGINELDEDVVMTGTKSNDDNGWPTPSLEDFDSDLQGVNVNAIEHDNNRDKGVNEVNLGIDGDDDGPYGDNDIPILSVADVGNKSQTSRPNFDTDKVDGYKSEYFDSSDPMSFIETSYGSDEDDAQRVKSSDKYYNPMVPFDDFVVGLRFENF
ncbi:hypothetical protein POUND7_003539, partial [Theobroma cacao]